MHDEIFVANQSLEQLRNLRRVIQELTIFGEERNRFIKQLIALENKDQLEKIEMEQLKFVQSIKLQKLLLTLHNIKRHSSNLINCTYDKIIAIEEEIDGKLHINEKVLHLKIIQTLLDYKICYKYGIEQYFYFQELLPIIEQHRQFEKIYSKKQQQYQMFFLGLVVQFIQKQEAQNYLQMYGLTVNYIKEKLEKLKKELKSITHELIVKQLFILLNLHLSNKLLKKHLKFEDTHVQQEIYVLLYDLEYSITEKLTIQFKRYYGRTLIQAVNFSISKLKYFIVDMDSGLNFDNDLLETKKSKKLSQYRIKRSSSSSLNELKQRASKQRLKSLKKIDQKNLKIKNQLFIPKRVNPNRQLQHKVEFKIQKNKLKLNIEKKQSKVSIKSIKDCFVKQTHKESENTINMEFTISKDEIEENHRPASIQSQQKLTYSKCMKNIITTSQQLQQMLCLRPSNNFEHVDFDQKKAKQDQPSAIIISKKNRSKRDSSARRISHNYSSIRTVEDKVEAINEHGKQHSQSSLYVPPPIKKILFKYMKTYIICVYFQSKRWEFPFFKELKSLSSSKLYHLYGNSYNFINIKQQNLIFKLTFLRNGQYLQNASIDLKQLSTKERIQSLFIANKVKKFISQLYYFGQDIMLFKLNVKFLGEKSKYFKYIVKDIKYQYQIYAYSIYINGFSLSKVMIKKILRKQQKFMLKLNKELQIVFDYNQEFNKRPVLQEKLIDANQMKFYSFFKTILAINHNLALIQRQQKSLKYLKTFSIFVVKLFKCLDRDKYYFVFESNKSERMVAVCKKISIQDILNGVRTIDELKKAIISQDKIYFECWSDVLLNKAILELPAKKYCVRTKKGYKVYYSKLIIENQIKLIYGHQKEIRWFLLVSLLEIEPIWLKSLPSSRERKIKSTKSLKFSRKEIKGHDVGIELCLMQHFKNAKINHPEIHFNKDIFRYFIYQYHWIYYQNKKRYFCFKNHTKIIYFTITENHLIYANSLKLQSAKTKEEIFDEFRNYLALKKKIFKIVIFETNQVVNITWQKDKILCAFQFEDVNHQIQIDKTEFTMFSQSNLAITGKLFNHKSFRDRLISIIKERLYEINHQRQ